MSVARAAGSPIVIEIPEDTARAVEPRLTRRLIALELADIIVPPPESAAAGSASLFFRILTTGPSAVRVELWQLGEAFGARSVSLHGSPQLTARRIALAAAELARQMRHRRLTEALKRKPEGAAEGDSALGEGFPIYGSVAIESALQGAFIGPSDAWLIGPNLGFELRFSSGPRIALEGSWLTGDQSELAGSRGIEWRELGLRPSFAISVATDVRLDVGASFFVAAVHHAGEVRIEGDASSRDAWSARTGGHLRFEPRLSRNLWLRLGLEGGALVRPWTAVAEGGDRATSSGLWLSGAIGAVLELGPDR